MIESLYEEWTGDQWLYVSRARYTYDGVTDTAIEDEQPVAYRLDPAYPNPFNPATTLSYSLPALEHVTLHVYDALGRQVATLVDEQQSPGQHHVRFEASGLPSGVYLYRLHAGPYTAIKTLVLLK